MNSRFIIIAILILVKVVGVASHARASFCESMHNNTDTFYGYGYDSDGLNEHGQMSIHKMAEVSACNKRFNDFLKSKGIY